MVTTDPGGRPGPISVVIPAHNEEAVLGQTLRTLLEDAAPGEFEVVVVPNGCTDATAEVARSYRGVTVLELPASSKASALNAGEELATGFPRIYLDADIQLSTACARALVAAVTPTPDGRPGLLAAAPRRVVVTAGRPLLVRAFYTINRRLPVYRDTLFGRGAIAVSRSGRDRFDRFPDAFADDLFLNSLFAVGERAEVASAAAVSATPLRTRDLLHRLARVRAANRALRTTNDGVPSTRGASWLFDVALPRPWLLPAAACYLALTLLAEFAARRAGAQASWGRDDSSRTTTGGGVR